MTFEQTDVLDVLHRNQPDIHLDAEWGAEVQEGVLAQVLESDDAHRRSNRDRRRAVTVALVASAAAAVPLGLSIGLPGSAPGGPSPAASLERLATIAGTTGPALAPGQYLDTRSRGTAPYRSDYPLAPGETRHGDQVWSSTEVWTNHDQMWIVPPDTGACLQALPLGGDVADSGYDTASADQLASLPTDPDGLAAYIDAHPDGDNRGTLNRYTAVTDLLWSGIASPALRSAALNVLAETSGLGGDEHTTDDQGRPAIRIDYPGSAGTESTWFDPTTAQVIERSGPAQSGGRYTDTVTSRDAVDHLPDLPVCPS